MRALYKLLSLLAFARAAKRGRVGSYLTHKTETRITSKIVRKLFEGGKHK